MDTVQVEDAIAAFIALCRSTFLSETSDKKLVGTHTVAALTLITAATRIQSWLVVSYARAVVAGRCHRVTAYLVAQSVVHEWLQYCCYVNSTRCCCCSVTYGIYETFRTVRLTHWSLDVDQVGSGSVKWYEVIFRPVGLCHITQLSHSISLLSLPKLPILCRVGR